MYLSKKHLILPEPVNGYLYDLLEYLSTVLSYSKYTSEFEKYRYTQHLENMKIPVQSILIELSEGWDKVRKINLL